MKVVGKVRCPNKYKDGTYSVEIHFPINCFNNLPVKEKQRTPIELKVDGVIYNAGISHTAENKYIWINPDCSHNGKKVRLSKIIFDAGFKNKDDILIDFHGNSGVVMPLDDDSPETIFHDEIQEPDTYLEGSIKTISVNAYERDSAARKKCIKHYGATCIKCGFNFEKVYGADAAGFIHVHHLIPLSEIQKEYKVDPIKDLRPLCPNCHAYVHMNGKCRDLDDVTIKNPNNTHFR